MSRHWAAILFLLPRRARYRDVLGQELPWLDDSGQGSRGPPVVVTRDEVEPARVRLMFTRSNCTRRGLGRRTLEACEAAAKSEGFSTLTLMATMAGLPLYTSFGFEITERAQIPMPDGTTIEGASMQKPIQ